MQRHQLRLSSFLRNKMGLLKLGIINSDLCLKLETIVSVLKIISKYADATERLLKLVLRNYNKISLDHFKFVQD